MIRRALAAIALALLAVPHCSDAWARGGFRSSGHHSGHFGGGVASGRFIAARPVFVPRTVFFAAPVIAYVPPVYYEYAPAMYYAPPPAYYDPPTYYAPPPYDYPQPAHSYPSSSGAYAPPPPNSGAVPETSKGPYASDHAFQYRLFCPDSKKYYPDATKCASDWLRVVPDGRTTRR